MRQARGGDDLSYPLLLATVALGTVLAPLNSTMLAVALPDIREDFEIGHGAISWLVSSYLIAMAVAQPLGGRLGDQLGRARVFRAGLVAFLALSLAAAFAPNFPMLIALRTGQALVGATVIPNGTAMLRETVPTSRLGRSTGITGAVISLSAAVGPVLGAGLLIVGSWRWLFLMNVPLVGLALVSQALLRYPERGERTRFAFDGVGALTFAALLAAVTFLLNSLRGGQNAIAVGVAGVGLLALGVFFVRRQRSSPVPVAEWSLFRNRSYTGATMHVLFSNLVMYTTLLSIPFFIKEVQDKGSGATGGLLGSMSLLMAFVAPLGGRLSDAWGRRYSAVGGGALGLVAVIVILAGLERDVAYGYLAASLAMMGVGVGLSMGAAGTAAVEAAPRELAGAAAGTNSMMRYFGSIVGAGILGAVLNTNAEAPGVGMFRLIFAMLAVMAALATAAALMIHRFVEAEPALEKTPVAASRVLNRP